MHTIGMISKNYLEGAKITADSALCEALSAQNLLIDGEEMFYAAANKTATVDIVLEKPALFNVFTVSEVLEAFFKLVIGVATAIVLLQLTQSVSYAAGGAILGVTCSCLISGAYLASKFRKAYATLPESNEKPRATADTAKALLTIAVPITIGSAGLQFLSVLEAKFYMGQLLLLSPFLI